MNKKICMAGLAAALAVGMSVGSTYAAEALSPSEQVNILSANVKTWKPTKGGSYVLTDLDGNGRLEVVTSYVTRKRTKAVGVWEVNADGNGIEACELPWEEDEEMPEVTQKNVPVYYDAKADMYYFVFGETNGTVIALKDGVLSCCSYEELDIAELETQNGVLSWISTSEHPLDGAPMEQILELAGESCAAFSVKAGE